MRWTALRRIVRPAACLAALGLLGVLSGCGCSDDAVTTAAARLRLCDAPAGLITHRESVGIPGTPRDRGRDMVLDQHNRVIVTGTTSSADGRGGGWMACYLPGGNLDATFGVDGQTELVPQAANIGFEPYAIAVDWLNRLWLGGNSKETISPTLTESYATVARAMPDGSPDLSFGVDGFLHIDYAGYAAVSGKGMACDAHGRGILGSHWRKNDTLRWTVRIHRLLDSGDRDLAFGTDGMVELPVGGANGLDAYVHSLIVDSAGRIVVSSTATQVGGGSAKILTRLDDAGNLDPTFGVNGQVEVSQVAPGTPGIQNASDAGWDVIEDLDGRYLVAGTHWDGSQWDMALYRFDFDGASDTSFGTDGRVTAYGHDIPGTDDFARGVAVTGDGTIFAAGSSRNAGALVGVAGDLDMVVWAFHEDGTPHDTFAFGMGKVFDDNVAGGMGDERAVAALVNPGDCALYVHGSSWAGSTEREDFATWQVR